MIFISQLVGKGVANPFFPDNRVVRAPGVVWEMGGADGLSPMEAGALVDDLASFGSPFLIFTTGGETVREDLFSLIDRARSQSMAAILLFTGPSDIVGAERLLADAGASLMLMDASVPGVEGFLARCRAAGTPVGVRQQLVSRHSVAGALSLAERTGSAAVIFQHPAASPGDEGRQTRDLMDEVYQAALTSPAMVATKGNRADAVYMYLRLRQGDPRPARELRTAIFRAATARFHADLAYVDASGAVFPEEHWRWGTVGSVRQRPFSRIWTDPEQPLLRGLRLRRLLIQGRCKLCGYLEICNGNQRARARAAGDLWASDPGCYLTDDEIAGDVP